MKLPNQETQADKNDGQPYKWWPYDHQDDCTNNDTSGGQQNQCDNQFWTATFSCPLQLNDSCLNET